MIIELTTLPVAREDSAAFEAGWASAAAILSRQPGYIGHRIGRKVEDAGVYVLEIEWVSLAAHTEEFAQSEAFQAFLGCFVPHLNGEAEVFHFSPA